MRSGKLLVRVLTQRNEFYVRIFERGIIAASDTYSNQTRSTPTAPERAALAIEDMLLDHLLQNFFGSNRYLKPNEPTGEFNMLSFAILAPLFYTAAAFSSLVFGIEQMRNLESWLGSRLGLLRCAFRIGADHPTATHCRQGAVGKLCHLCGWICGRCPPHKSAELGFGSREGRDRSKQQRVGFELNRKLDRMLLWMRTFTRDRLATRTRRG